MGPSVKDPILFPLMLQGPPKFLTCSESQKTLGSHSTCTWTHRSFIPHAMVTHMYAYGSGVVATQLKLCLVGLYQLDTDKLRLYCTYVFLLLDNQGLPPFDANQEPWPHCHYSLWCWAVWCQRSGRLLCLQVRCSWCPPGLDSRVPCTGILWDPHNLCLPFLYQYWHV